MSGEAKASTELCELLHALSCGIKYRGCGTIALLLQSRLAAALVVICVGMYMSRLPISCCDKGVANASHGCFQVPNGEITSHQLRVLGNLIKPYGDELGVGDITTRANFQLRGITLGDADKVIQAVQECGLSNVQSGNLANYSCLDAVLQALLRVGEAHKTACARLPLRAFL